MHSVHFWGAVELAKVERLVQITNALIELQRELIDYQYQAGGDVNPAISVFDGLSESLSSCVAHRHRLREIVSAEACAA